MITKLFISYVLVPYVYKYESQPHLYQTISHKWVNLGISPSSPSQESKSSKTRQWRETTIRVHHPSIL